MEPPVAKAAKKTSLFKIFMWAVLCVAVFLFLDVVRFFFHPYVGDLARTNPARSAFMEYREAQWEREGRKMKLRQTWVPLTRISPYLVRAVLIAEDDKFYDHEGFDYDALQKAIEKDLAERKFKVGASTISQQLAKNLYLSPSKNPIRKIKEAILTWRIERALSKKRILELYLNVAEWGDGVFGIEAGSRSHFGKPASALTAEEAARMASVLPNPIRFNPRGSQGYVVKRSRIIYKVMLNRGIVIPDLKEVEEDNTPSPTAPVQPLPEAASVGNGPAVQSGDVPGGQSEAAGPASPTPESTPTPAP